MKLLHPDLIEHVLMLSGLRNIEIQVMPQVRVDHAGLDGPIQLLETRDNNWLAYCEGQESGQLNSDRKVVSILQMRYARNAVTGPYPRGRHEPVAEEARSSMVTTELAWFKSSYSGGSGDSCVEVALSPPAVHVRDSKVEQGPQLDLSPASWTSFVSYAAQV